MNKQTQNDPNLVKQKAAKKKLIYVLSSAFFLIIGFTFMIMDLSLYALISIIISIILIILSTFIKIPGTLNNNNTEKPVENTEK